MNQITKLRITVAYWLWKLSNRLYPNGFNPPVIVDKPNVSKYPSELKRGGRVVTVTAPAEYDFEKASRPRKGGRVVKLMPRQLKKVKEGQEKQVSV